jgi:hypothetical protein
MRLYRNLLWVFLVCIGSITIAKGVYELGQVLYLESQAPLDDYFIYTTVGRGILNGLIPYVDLFETKPPGMFLLSALSLLMSGNEMLAVVLQILFLVALPILFIVLTLRQTEKGTPIFWKLCLAIVAFASGTLLALFLEERSGLLQTELFGSLFCIVYITTFFLKKEGIGIDIVRSLSILGAVMMKEPFLLTLFASAILLARSRRDFIWSFLVPGIAALAGGILLLALLGYLQAYIEIYLPTMLGNRFQAGGDAPLFLRALWVRRLLSNVTEYWNSPLFGYVLLALCALFPLLERSVSKRGMILGAIFGLVLLLLSHVNFSLLHVLYILHYHIPTRDLFFWQLLGVCVLLLLVIIFLSRQLSQESKQLVSRFFIVLLGIFSVTMAIGMPGGYNDYHFAFAVPFFAALLLIFLRYGNSPYARAELFLPLSLLLCLAVMFYQPNPKHMDYLRAQTHINSHSNRDTIRAVDQLLTACESERYVNLGAHQKLAFAKHSPIGPLFLRDVFSYLPKEHPLVQKTEENMEQWGRIAIADENYTGDSPDSLFAVTNVPDCAKPYLPIPGVTVLFRKQ